MVDRAVTVGAAELVIGRALGVSGRRRDDGGGGGGHDLINEAGLSRSRNRGSSEGGCGSRTWDGIGFGRHDRRSAIDSASRSRNRGGPSALNCLGRGRIDLVRKMAADARAMRGVLTTCVSPVERQPDDARCSVSAGPRLAGSTSGAAAVGSCRDTCPSSPCISSICVDRRVEIITGRAAACCTADAPAHERAQKRANSAYSLAASSAVSSCMTPFSPRTF